MNVELTFFDEERALAEGEDMFATGEFVGVRVLRETLDPETGIFTGKVLLRLGDQDDGKFRRIGSGGSDSDAISCRQAADFYQLRSRLQLARLLEGWLGRNKLTPFELLHRLDLAERLQLASTETQHAIQKVAVARSLGRGASVHQVVRALQGLFDQAVAALRADRAAGVFVAVAPASFAGVCRELAGTPRAAYRLAGGVADFIGAGETWSDKANLLLDLVDAAPDTDPARALAAEVLTQPLGEILASKAACAELLGADLDLGGQIAATVRLVAPDAAEAVAQADPEAAALIPPLGETAQRIAERLALFGFDDVRHTLSRRLLQDLMAPRRLRPADPAGEIRLTRALGFVLSAADRRILPAEEVRDALIERSRLMVSQDFMDAYLGAERPAMDEAFGLARLMDNLAGGANRAQAARWLEATITSPRFDTELVSGPGTPMAKLAQLAQLHRTLARSRNDAGRVESLLERISLVADKYEDAKGVVRQLVRAQAPLPQRLGALLRMAAGETAPPGGAASRARTEAKRMLAEPGTMAELSRDPAALKQLQGLMRAI